MSINISDIIPIIIVFQSFLFAIVLLTDNGPKKICNRYLASFLTLLGVQFMIIVGESIGVELYFLSSNTCIFGFSYGPLLFLYSKTLIYKSFNFNMNQLLHFIPAGIIMLCSVFGYFLCETVRILIYLSLLTYISLAIREMLNYRRILRETQSSLNRTDLVWLQWTMIIFSIALLLHIVDQFLWNMYIAGGISSIHITILLLVNWMFYKGLKQPQIFLGITKMDKEVLNDIKNTSFRKDPDSDEQLDLHKIKSFMEESEYYTNPQSNLKDLADELELSPRRVSYLINTFCNQHFLSFVNDYRIEKAKSQLENPLDASETILEVMYDVGFNSKSSFFTIFKKKTGLTPSAYKNKYAT